jgi:hypothetical protein
MLTSSLTTKSATLSGKRYGQIQSSPLASSLRGGEYLRNIEHDTRVLPPRF